MRFDQVEEPHKHSPGPTLLLAGPGSGKTHSLGLRIKWLVEEMMVDPKAITVITFTTEAARNLRLRLSDERETDVYMPKGKQPGIVCTMHSLGHQIIRRGPETIGLSEDFRVVSSDELRTAIFGDAAQLSGYGRKLGSEAKAAKMKAEPMPVESSNAQICGAYSSILRACNAIDHDDQIHLACEILRENPALLVEYQEKASHLLVDEYQDINPDQFKLIRLISEKSRDGLYVVGDDDQSIYGFRGGSPEFIRHFDEHFGEDASVLTLPYCRRCPKSVLNGALGVAKTFNADRLNKPDLAPLNTDKAPIVIYDLPSDEREASLIAQICTKVLPAHDVLILVPTTKFAEPIKRALKKRRIHYDSRSSIDDEGLAKVSRLFDFLADPQDSLALRQCIHVLCENGAIGIPGPGAKKREKIDERENALKVISTLWERVLNDQQTLLESLQNGSAMHPALGALRDHVVTLQEAYGSDIDVFLQAIGRIMKPWKKPDELAMEIRSWMGEITARSGGGEGVARVLTMRMAKGLEADHVFIVGLEEDVFPNLRWSGDALLESARLFYVSMTRARTQLYICHVRKRDASITFLPASYGLKPSRFLGAIPKDCLQVRYIPRNSKGKSSKSTS